MLKEYKVLSLPCCKLIQSFDVHRSGSTKRPLLAFPWSSESSQQLSFLHVCRTYMNPSRPAAMKRGRPSLWVWQWRDGRGESVQRGCMRFEVVLNAYRHLRWDGDAIRRVGHTFASVSTTISLLETAFSSPHHVLPLAPYHSYQPGSIFRLVQINPHGRFLQIPTPTHSNFYLPFHIVLAPPIPPRLSHLHIQARVRGSALRCRRQTTGSRSHLLGSIPAE